MQWQRMAGQADLYALHAQQPDGYPILLESRSQSAATGRYSLLLTECGSERQLLAGEDPAVYFDGLRPGQPLGPEQAALPFRAGWFVYLSYELAPAFESHLLGLPATAEPLARAVYCRGAIVVDHLEQCTWMLSESGATQRHCDALQAVAPSRPVMPPIEFREEPAEHYLATVAQAIEYIHAGDVYQVNLARRWQGPALPQQGLIEHYRRLRAANAAPFCASVQMQDFALASASPERLFRSRAELIETRPIAGTRPRHADPQADALLRAELTSNRKERAEHIMLVDLERHDLGRLCTPGSVQVDQLEVLESYASVHHLVSNIRGQLRANVTLAQILRAIFPGGTITGCPKIRCMQIIGELERRPRGAYTGGIGYLSNGGDRDFNILIRSLVWQQGRCHFDAGAGIVADSQPAAELAETRAKAAGMLRALALP